MAYQECIPHGLELSAPAQLVCSVYTKMVSKNDRRNEALKIDFSTRKRRPNLLRGRGVNAPPIFSLLQIVVYVHLG
jgi:hypothetical protein